MNDLHEARRGIEERRRIAELEASLERIAGFVVQRRRREDHRAPGVAETLELVVNEALIVKAAPEARRRWRR